MHIHVCVCVCVCGVLAEALCAIVRWNMTNSNSERRQRRDIANFMIFSRADACLMYAQIHTYMYARAAVRAGRTCLRVRTTLCTPASCL